MLRQFLPSTMRGVYRFNQQLHSYVSDGDAHGFVLTKKAFLPRHYLELIESLINFPKNEADTLKSETPNKGKLSDHYESRIKAFFSLHEYLSVENNKNYLERQFILEIIDRIFKDNWIKSLDIVPQHSVKRYKLDFAISGEKKYAIELDGFGKFQQRADLDSFLRRQNEIVAEGWTIYRFSYADVIENTGVTVDKLKDILSKDSKLLPLIRKANSQDNLFNIQNKNITLCSFVDSFYAIQDYFFKQVIEEKKHLKTVIIKEDLGYSFSVAALALSDLYFSLENLSKIFEVDFHLPKIVLDKSLFQKIKSFVKNNPEILHSKIEFSSIIQTNFVLKKEILAETIDEFSYFYQPIERVSFRPDTTGYAIQNARDKLINFSKSIFGYSDIRYKQDEILEKILAKTHVLGLLPTGSGKSFCFWLPALIKPGLTIVISPLRALMRDQDISLKLFGIYSTAFINSDVKDYQRQAIYTDIKLGRIRLLYIAPERMQIKSFTSELNEILKIVPVNFLVIDEAHCVSEWGHDFRPSYLRIPQFAEKLSSHDNHEMTIIALTATAGDIVKNDMMRILKLNDSHIVSAKNFDRPNLSMQFVTVDNYPKKAEKYEQTLINDLPKALHKQGINEIFQPTNNEQTTKGVGLIFCIYADSHGKHTINDSVGHYLRETQKLIEGNNVPNLDDFSTGNIRGFSSKEPTLCPKCTSSRYVSDRQSSNGLADDFEENADVLLFEDDIDETKKASPKICKQCDHKFLSNKAKKTCNYL